jgi:chemotaxis protein CheZ
LTPLFFWLYKEIAMSDKDWNAVLTRIRNELSDLAHYVDNARKGIESLETTVKLSTEKFPEASRNLSSITGDLETAANSIIAILESMIGDADKAQRLIAELASYNAAIPADRRTRFDALIKELDAVNSGGKAATMDMFTFVSFHDLSGQKLKKVMDSLATVETKIAELAQGFGFDETSAQAKAEVNEHSKVSQDAIDMLIKQKLGQ